MLGYLVNTLIFVLVGLVIAQRAFSGVENMDWIFLVALYFGSITIRYVIFLLLVLLLLTINEHVEYVQIHFHLPVLLLLLVRLPFSYVAMTGSSHECWAF